MPNHFRKGVLIALFTAWLTGAASSPPWAAADGVPQLFFPEKRFEFGTVLEGVDVRHDFVVENRGDAPLIIQRVQPD